MRRSASEAAHDRARAVSPGGVHSPVRAFGAVEGAPVFFDRARGSTAWDLDGNALVDLCMWWGPLPLGHAPETVVTAVQEAASRGLSFGACHEGETHLARAILQGFPDFDRVRLVSSGTEAVMTALRLARGITGRPRVLKFEGGYHGHVDALLVKAGSGLATSGIATSAGVPAEIASTTLVAPLGDESAVEAHFDSHGAEIACVIVEPLPANNGLLPQAPSFLAALRAHCDAHATLLIFDEVISGFRLRHGGLGPVIGVQPDLVTLGKIVGGGMPIGAVAGRAALMDRLAPEGDVYQAGTLSGNPVSVAAGLATLDALRDGTAHERLEQLGARLEDSLSDATPNLQVQRRGSIVWPYLSHEPLPRRASEIDPRAADRFRKLHARVLKRGFYMPPSAFEVCFLSTAHSESEIDAFATALVEEVSRLD